MTRQPDGQTELESEADNKRLRAEPHLGLATTRELLDELRARIEMHALGGLDYRTVDGEKFAEESNAPLRAEVEQLKKMCVELSAEVERVRAARIQTRILADSEVARLTAEKSELADAILRTASETHIRTLVSFELAEFIFTERFAALDRKP